METLVNLMTLKVYGDQLLNSRAKLWLSITRLFAVVMAFCEALSWSMLGFFKTQGTMRWVYAIVIFSFVFLVIYALDVLFITHDNAASEHSKLLPAESRRTTESVAQRSFAYVVRILILGCSLHFAAPFLAEFIFQQDIAQYLDDQAAVAISDVRTNMHHDLDNKLTALDQMIAEKRNAYEDEVSGTGASKHYGNGPAAKAIQRDLELLESQRAKVNTVGEDELASFEKLVDRWKDNRQVLESKYKVKLPKQSVLTNKDALRELSKNESYRQTERTIIYLLGIIFTSILAAKARQPSAAAYYLSDVMQQQFGSYLAGGFDSELPPWQLPSNDAYTMSPDDFYAFLEKHALNAVHERLNELQAMKGQAERELGALKPINDKLFLLSEERNGELNSLTMQQTSLSDDLAEAGRKASLPIDETVDFETGYTLAAHRRAKLAEIKGYLASVDAKLPALRLAAERAQQEFSAFDRLVEEKKTEIERRRKEIIDLIDQQAEKIKSNALIQLHAAEAAS